MELPWVASCESLPSKYKLVTDNGERSIISLSALATY